MHIVNQRILNLLKNKRITQEQAADALGIKQPTFFRKIRQVRPLASKDIEKLAALVGVEVAFIMGSQDIPGTYETEDMLIDVREHGTTGTMKLEPIVTNRYDDIERRLDNVEGLLHLILARINDLKR